MDSYKDLVRRLRAEAEAWDSPHTVTGPSIGSMLREAASAIEAMERMITDISMRKPSQG